MLCSAARARQRSVCACMSVVEGGDVMRDREKNDQLAGLVRGQKRR